MTALAAPCARPRTTRFERALLRTSDALRAYVALRLERRAASAFRRAEVAASGFRAERAAAEAHGAFGILPP